MTVKQICILFPKIVSKGYYTDFLSIAVLKDKRIFKSKDAYYISSVLFTYSISCKFFQKKVFLELSVCPNTRKNKQNLIKQRLSFTRNGFKNSPIFIMLVNRLVTYPKFL